MFEARVQTKTFAADMRLGYKPRRGPVSPGEESRLQRRVFFSEVEKGLQTMNMAIVKRGLAAAVLFAGLSPVACGSDSGTGDTTGKVNGTGGSANGNENQDAGPKTPPPSSGDVPCGEKNCTVPEGSTGPACCMDPFNSICGIKGGIGNGCVKPPPPQPKECPMLPAIGGVFTFRNCCTTSNICGIDASMFGGGCIDYATFKSMASMYMGGGMGGMGGMGGRGGFGMFTITLPDTDPPCTQPASAD
jgi:hypothetical protein